MQEQIGIGGILGGSTKAKVLIVHYSRSGNTEKMAQLIGQGTSKAGVVAEIKKNYKVKLSGFCLLVSIRFYMMVEIKKIAEVKPDDPLFADGIILGSTTYYRFFAIEIKSLLDLSVKHLDSLTGRIVRAFAKVADYDGGAGTTVLSMLQVLFIYGLIIQLDPENSAYYGTYAFSVPYKKYT